MHKNGHATSRWRAGRLAISILAASACPAVIAEEAMPEAAARPNPAAAIEIPTIEVIGSTPLPALGTPLDQYPGNVQSLSADGLEKQNALDVSEALFRNLGSVNLNNAQNNPYQADITYRGFLAGPLTGSAIGLSVYVDGVRYNDGFGDTVNWDLIPQAAISSIDVIPGSNPLFGLNTLGGALAVRTKSGFSFQGTEAEVSGGSFGRRGIEIEHGGNRGAFDWYFTLNRVDEDGWRDASGTDVRQAFAKVGWENERTDVDLQYIGADNDLTGNGFAPASLLERDREAVHTFPDNTRNEQDFFNLRVSHAFTPTLLVASNVFHRQFDRATINGDAEVECEDEVSGQTPFLDPDGEDELPVSLCEGASDDFFDEAGNPLAGGELEREADGEDRRTATDSRSQGATLQLSQSGRLFGTAQRFTLGLAYDGSDNRYTQSERGGDIVEVGNSRTIVGEGEFETEVDVDTRQDNVGVYFSEALDLTDTLTLTLSGRYQNVEIEIRDRTGEEENADLNGDHEFNRFSPAAGLTWQLRPGFTLFGSIGEGFRSPTAAELTCADPDDPCNLPNAFVADPPLDPVIARTIEFGARGKHASAGKAKLRWNLGLFQTRLSDDILFTVVESGGAGFFQNVDETRRQGLETGLAAGWGRLDVYASYAFIDATYESAVTLASFVEAAGTEVEPGDRLPGIARHNLRLGADYALLESVSVGADFSATGKTYLRGDDGNDLPQLDAYAIINLRVRYEPTPHFELWGRLDNAADTDFETAGTRNFNAFADPIEEERFLAPGAPRAGWVGVKARF
ncbi:MAG: TonB-dependent receptor [Panacagrimonas sp.]